MTSNIVLCMIIKDEATVILRCLESVRRIIDYWIIVDTGSSDGTQKIIRDHMDGIAGELHEREWRDFASNRSEALSLARPHGRYALIIDADDTLEIPANFDPDALHADSYSVDIVDCGIHYRRTQLVRNELAWRYRGVLHEYLTCDEAKSSGHAPLTMHRNHDGARRLNPKTYQHDAAILTGALEHETDPFLISRYHFYLAQSHRDAGDKIKAVQGYLKRAELGYWDEEVYVSLYQAAKIKEELGEDVDDVLSLYMRASQIVAGRAEALHGAVRLCRNAGRNEQGYQIGKKGLGLEQPTSGLFIEPWVYQYGLLDEYSVNAYWAGHYKDCLDASLKILAAGKLQGAEQSRVLANAQAASAKLPAEPNLGSLALPSFVDQHPMRHARQLRPLITKAPRVLIALLAKQKEFSLPLYLQCLEMLDYPKSSIVLYVRTNNNTDRTEPLLREWLERVGHLYADVEFDAEDVATRVEQFGGHEWNDMRLRVLCRIRNISLSKTIQHDCDFYFIADADNFVRPCTLRELVSLNLPIVAPFLRSVDPNRYYSNYHAELDANGYYAECDQYYWILQRRVRGLIEMPLVHTTYLIRRDVLQSLFYEDYSSRFDYVIFSDAARRAEIPQYFDNRQVFGYIMFDSDSHLHFPGGLELAQRIFHAEFEAEHARKQDQKRYTTILPHVIPYEVSGSCLVRVGHSSDGGYIMLDDFDHDMICVSLGIAYEVSWDLELADRGAQIYQFDNSVDGPPVEHLNFHFRRLSIALDDSQDGSRARLDTLSNELNAHGHYKILKMDIEGSEWAVLDETTSAILSTFDQIIIEFHGLTRIQEDIFGDTVQRVWTKLAQTHFPAHTHGNNFGSMFQVGDFSFPDVIEVTYANRSRYTQTGRPTRLPSHLDRPCRADRSDVDLSTFQTMLAMGQ